MSSSITIQRYSAWNKAPPVRLRIRHSEASGLQDEARALSNDTEHAQLAPECCGTVEWDIYVWCMRL